MVTRSINLKQSRGPFSLSRLVMLPAVFFRSPFVLFDGRLRIKVGLVYKNVFGVCI